MAKRSNTAVPPQSVDLDRRKQLRDSITDSSKNGSNIFFAILLACSYSMLAIANTNDEDLLTNSTTTPLPIIQTSVPIVWFYYAAPALLFAAFLYFHLYLTGLWSSLGEFRLRHSDGKRIDENVYPWLISSAMLRATERRRRLGWVGRVLRNFETVICIVLAWFLVPGLILIFLVRFLPRHDVWGTGFHVFLFAANMAAATGFLAGAISMLKEGPSNEADERAAMPARYGAAAVVFFAFVLGLGYVALGALRGSPGLACGQTGKCGPLYAGARLLERAGIDFRADIAERDVSGKPQGWTSAKDDDAAAVETVRKAALQGRDLRHAKGNGAFLIGADLRHADLGWADLDNAKLQFTRLDSAAAISASLSEAHMYGANLTRANIADAWLTQSDLRGSTLVDVNAAGAHLNSADLAGSTGERSGFQGADLRFAKFNDAELSAFDFTDANMKNVSAIKAIFNRSNFNGANLGQADFEDADLASASFRNSFLQYANFKGASLTRADLQGADLRQASLQARDANDANFSGAKLNSADFTGIEARNAKFAGANLSAAILDGSILWQADFTGAELSRASLRGTVLVGAKFDDAKGLTQAQLASACGDSGTKLPDGLSIPECGQTNINPRQQAR